METTSRNNRSNANTASGNQCTPRRVLPGRSAKKETDVSGKARDRRGRGTFIDPESGALTKGNRVMVNTESMSFGNARAHAAYNRRKEEDERKAVSDFLAQEAAFLSGEQRQYDLDGRSKKYGTAVQRSQQDFKAGTGRKKKKKKPKDGPKRPKYAGKKGLDVSQAELNFLSDFDNGFLTELSMQTKIVTYRFWFSAEIIARKRHIADLKLSRNFRDLQDALVRKPVTSVTNMWNIFKYLYDSTSQNYRTGSPAVVVYQIKEVMSRSTPMPLQIERTLIFKNNHKFVAKRALADAARAVQDNKISIFKNADQPKKAVNIRAEIVERKAEPIVGYRQLPMKHEMVGAGHNVYSCLDEWCWDLEEEETLGAIVGAGPGGRNVPAGSNLGNTSRAEPGKGGKAKGWGDPKAGKGPNAQSSFRDAVEDMLKHNDGGNAGGRGPNGGDSSDSDDSDDDAENFVRNEVKQTSKNTKEGEKTRAELKNELIRARYVTSALPMQEVLTMEPEEPTSWYDCGGAPFCGVTAIDFAAGIAGGDFKAYVRHLAAHKVKLCDAPKHMGTPESLNEWAISRGLNLSIRYSHNNQQVAKFENSPAFKWVTLGYESAASYALRTAKESTSKKKKCKDKDDAPPDKDPDKDNPKVPCAKQPAGPVVGGANSRRVNPPRKRVLPVTRRKPRPEPFTKKVFNSLCTRFWELKDAFAGSVDRYLSREIGQMCIDMGDEYVAVDSGMSPMELDEFECDTMSLESAMHENEVDFASHFKRIRGAGGKGKKKAKQKAAEARKNEADKPADKVQETVGAVDSKAELDQDDDIEVGHFLLGLHGRSSFHVPSTLEHFGCRRVFYRQNLYDIVLYYSAYVVSNAVCYYARIGLWGLGVHGLLPMLALTSPFWVCLPYIAYKLTDYTPECKWLGMTIDKTVEFYETYTPSNDRDTRSILDRRDRLEHQEAYVSAEFAYHYTLDVLGYEILNVMLPRWMCTWHREDWEYVVLAERFKACSKEMQVAHSAGLDPNKVLMSLNVMRGVNYEASRPRDFADTAAVLKEYGCALGSRKKEAQPLGFVQYNQRGAYAHMPDEEPAAMLQNRGLVGGGYNHITGSPKSGEAFWRLDENVRKPVAVAPLGAIITDRGPVMAGSICLTDSESTLAGLITRGMAKDPREVDEKKVAIFIKEANKFYDRILSMHHVSYKAKSCTFVEANIACFREVYKGKRSQAFIDTKIDLYMAYVTNKLKQKERSKFQSNSCFVKFESNIKESGGKLRPRPRIIMTMSDLMLFELIQLIPVVHEFYEGPMSRYQVKGYNMDDMSKVIEEFSSNGAMVTDASAFESSLTSKLCAVERRVFKTLLERSGLVEVAEAFDKHYYTDSVEDRELVTKWGSFCIDTRCSGDFITSAGNGIMNVAFAVYALRDYHRHKKLDDPGKWFVSKNPDEGIFEVDRFRDVQIIAEGDDGLVVGDTQKALTAERLAPLGIKFSSEVSGTRMGDVDFLRTLWQDGKRYLNVGRALSIFWVKKGHCLSRGKQLWLLRQAALSLHHRSPGHPVLAAAIWRIKEATRDIQPFKNDYRYIDNWKARPKDPFPSEYYVDETMRERVAQGAIGFPGIPVTVQLELENRLLNDKVMYIGSLLNNYEEITDCVDCVTERMNKSDKQFKSMLKALNVRSKNARLNKVADRDDAYYHDYDL